MNDRSFIFYPEWLDYIQRVADADKLDLYNIIVEYGCHGEYSNENAMMVNIFESFIRPKIDTAQKNYEEKINAGKMYGRKKTVDDEQIAFLAQQGFKAKQIASSLGVSTDAVYHSDGWKNRNL